MLDRNLTIIGDFGRISAKYSELIKNRELMKFMRDPHRENVYLGTTILSYSRDWLDSHPSDNDVVTQMKKMLEENPLMFFLPSGEGGLKFLNDLDHDVKMMIAPNRVGKAQPVNTPVLTPVGFKPIGSISIGDTVYGEDGKMVKVSGVFPQGSRPVYRITFNHGEVETLCDRDHLWKYLKHTRSYSNSSHKKNYKIDEYEVLTTLQILRIQGANPTSQQTGYIPLCKPVEFYGSTMEIPSYSLGALLGDGSLGKYHTSFSSRDTEIVQRMQNELPDCQFVKQDLLSADWRINKAKKLRVSLENIGLQETNCFTKFIPESYKFSPVYERIQLLRGLMDTDGTVNKNGNGTEFCTVSKRLSEDVQFIVRSLGGRVNVYERYTNYSYKGEKKRGALSYRLMIHLNDINPFFLERKAKKWKPCKRRNGRLVTKIEYVGEMECVCIMVDNESHTYLTNDFIVTHNTAHSVVDIILDIVPTDPNWPIFKDHGVKWRPFKPIKCGFASFAWRSVQRTLWPEICKWIPKIELGEYDPRLKNAKQINWKGEAMCRLACDSELFMFCYEQAQGAFESQALGRWLWDEQGYEFQFDGGDERLRTVRGGRHVFALTPHVVQGRPDTGARSWIHKMLTGEITKGHKVSEHHVSIPDVPDWVYSEEAKLQAKEKWVDEPRRTNNQKAIKEGEARYYGKWHDASGLVFDEWDDGVHFIDRFEIPASWTRYRALDHGINNPTAVLWLATSPEGNVFVYDEYFESGFNIFENARNIVLKSGNELRKVGTEGRYGMFCDRYVEQCVKQRFRISVGDSRSLAGNDPGSGLGVQKLYAYGGLRLIPASGKNPKQYHGVVKQYLSIDANKKHPITGKMGSPSVFVFRDLVNFRREIKNYAVAQYANAKLSMTKNKPERANEKDDHLMDAFIYGLQIPPRYVGGVWASKDGKYTWDVPKNEDEEEINEAKPIHGLRH